MLKKKQVQKNEMPKLFLIPFKRSIPPYKSEELNLVSTYKCFHSPHSMTFVNAKSFRLKGKSDFNFKAKR